MAVEIDPKTQDLIEQEVRSGRAANAGEVVRQAVEHFVIARELGDPYTLAEIENKIGRGLASLDQGEGMDGDEFLASLEGELKGRLTR